MSKSIPATGLNTEEIHLLWETYSQNDMNWKEGKFFGYVYYPGDEYYATIKEAYAKFSATNALNPAVFPSLKNMENEVIQMAATLLHGDEQVTGTMTSGGTESIYMAVRAAKEWAKKNKQTKNPLLLLAETAHPAFCKAADAIEFNYKLLKVDSDFKLDVEDLKKQLSSDVVLIVGSAPSYPQGAIDPIEKLAVIAKQHKCLLHVDACVGGFILPFLKMEGYDLPKFDFEIDGVTSISADIHKYGYAAKGASVVLYKNTELRKGQFYVKTDWSGGIYGSPSFMGTRGGGPIAAAWTALHLIGEEGYRRMAREVMEETHFIKHKIKEEIPELKILGNPQATLFAFSSDTIDVYEVADELAELGWTINRQQLPASLHVLLNYIHVGKGELFINDLKIAVQKAKRFTLSHLKNNLQVSAVKQLKKMLNEQQFKSLTQRFAGNENPESKRSAAMYGMMSELSGSGSLKDMVIDFLDKLYKPDKKN
ncbi:MAG TPA: aspartate aminotransferase family protein [Chitinophagales bacterium]|nr:aspartate aminotransferase family protein [Chitinophagales bacterium]HNM32494.1 aspartate aminotransferase family protein [Chitinophagales bacterium]